MRGFIVVFRGAYEIASLSSRTTCLPDRQARIGYSSSVNLLCLSLFLLKEKVTKKFKGGSESVIHGILIFLLVFMIAAQFARLSGQRHQTSLLNSKVLIIVRKRILGDGVYSDR